MGRAGTRGALVVWTSVVLLATAGCAEESSQPAEQPTVTASSGGAVPVLRLGDDGAQVELVVDGTASVQLPASYEWTEPAVDGDAVTVTRDVSDDGMPSRSWTVVGRQSGSATLTLTGSPTCRSETPSCAAPDLLWTAGFTVS